MSHNNIFEKFQSGLRALLSTKYALKVTNNLLLAVDRGGSMILILLDLFTAFNTVDYAILLDHHDVSFHCFADNR